VDFAKQDALDARDNCAGHRAVGKKKKSGPRWRFPLKVSCDGSGTADALNKTYSRRSAEAVPNYPLRNWAHLTFEDVMLGRARE